MDTGWIKIYRKLLDWEWYDDTNTFRLFIHLLLTVNYEDKKWRGINLEAGESIKSLETLSLETNLSVQNIRTVIDKLKSTGELTERQHGKHRILKLKNYKQHQDTNRDSNNELTTNQQGTNIKSTADKEVKKERKKEVKNITTNVVTAKADNRNPEINNMLIALKQKVGIEAFVDSRIERNMAKHCLGLMNKITPTEFSRRLDALLDDPFTAKNCNKIKFIYNNIKGFVEPKKSSNIVKL